MKKKGNRLSSLAEAIGGTEHEASSDKPSLLLMVSLGMCLVLAFALIYVRSPHSAPSTSPRSETSSTLDLTKIKAPHKRAYKFNWELSDFDDLVAYPLGDKKGSRLVDVLAKFGRASDVSDLGWSLVLYYHFDEEVAIEQQPKVVLSFNKFDDDHYYLATKAFVNFPAPVEFTDQLNAQGKVLTKQEFDGLIIWDEGGNVRFSEVATTYAKPDLLTVDYGDRGRELTWVYSSDHRQERIKLVFAPNQQGEWFLLAKEWN